MDFFVVWATLMQFFGKIQVRPCAIMYEACRTWLWPSGLLDLNSYRTMCLHGLPESVLFVQHIHSLESSLASLWESFAWLPAGSYPMMVDSVFLLLLRKTSRRDCIQRYLVPSRFDYSCDNWTTRSKKNNKTITDIQSNNKWASGNQGTTKVGKAVEKMEL